MSGWDGWGAPAGAPPPAPTGGDANRNHWGGSGTGSSTPAPAGDAGWGAPAPSPSSGGGEWGWGGTPAPATSGTPAAAAGGSTTGQAGVAGSSAWSRHPRIPKAYGGFDWWEERDKAPAQSGTGSGWDTGGSGWGSGGGGGGWGDSGGWGASSSSSSSTQQKSQSTSQAPYGAQILWQSTLPVDLQRQYRELREQYSNQPGKTKLMRVVAYVGNSRDVVYLPPRFPDSMYAQGEGRRPKALHNVRPFDLIDRKQYDAAARSLRTGDGGGGVADRLVPTVAVGLHGLQGKAAQMGTDYRELEEGAVGLAADLRKGLQQTAEHLRQAESLQLQQSRINRRLVSAVSALDDALLQRQGPEAQGLTDGERQLADAVRELEEQLARRPRYEGRLEALHDLYRRSASSFAAGVSAQAGEAAGLHDRFLPEVARHLARHSAKIQDMEAELEQAERHVYLMEQQLGARRGAVGVGRGRVTRRGS